MQMIGAPGRRGMPGEPVSIRRVLLVDDDERVRSAIPAMIASWPGYTVLPALDRADDLAQRVVRDRPDVVLLDIDMPGRSPFHAMEDLRYRASPAKVLVLSALADAPTVRACLHAGAAGYVLKEDGPEALREGIETVLMGSRYLSPRVASGI